MSKRFITVNDNWVENPEIGGKTRIFSSPDETANPDFNLDAKFLYNVNVPNVYLGHVIKHLGKFLVFILHLVLYINAF